MVPCGIMAMMTMRRGEEQPRRVDEWFGPVPELGAVAAGGGADLDVVDFHRWAAGELQRVHLASVGTLTRLNRERERRW